MLYSFGFLSVKRPTKPVSHVKRRHLCKERDQIITKTIHFWSHIWFDQIAPIYKQAGSELDMFTRVRLE